MGTARRYYKPVSLAAGAEHVFVVDLEVWRTNHRLLESTVRGGEPSAVG